MSGAPQVVYGDFVSQSLLIFQNPVLRLVRPSVRQLDLRELHSVPHDLQPGPTPTSIVDGDCTNVRERNAERSRVRACVSQEPVFDDKRLSSKDAANPILLLFGRHDCVEEEVERLA